MTTLTKPVRRATAANYQHRAIVITLAPLGGQSEALIGMRLKGRRSGYVARVSDVFNILAEWHGNKERAAKREARKNQVPWKVARRKFLAGQRI